MRLEKPRLRGVSPVVATALLILISVVTAALLYLWVSGTVQNVPQNANQLQEQIKIDAVEYTKNTNSSGTYYNFMAYVRNVGQIAARISSAYVINENGTVAGSNTAVNAVIAPGTVETVTINNVPADELGRVVQIKVVTQDGVEATYILTLRG